MRFRAVALALLLALSGIARAAQTPQQATVVIVGQAVDAVTGAAIPEAIVTLSLAINRMLPGRV